MTTPDKCYSFSITGTNPSPPVQGQSATWAMRIKNESKGSAGLQLGSANVTADPAITNVAAGTTSVGTITAAGNVVQLRNLNLAPGRTVVFTVSATAPLQAGTYTWTSSAKQSNDYNGTGNNLTALGGGSASTVIASSCVTVPEFNSCGSNVIVFANGGTVQSGSQNSDGGPAQVRASTTYDAKPTVTGQFLASLYTSVSPSANCPTLIEGECKFVVSFATKFPAVYQLGDISATITCDPSYCTNPANVVFVQTNELTGAEEVLPPCLLGMEQAVPPSASGSTACITDNGDGTWTIFGITPQNDWKVGQFDTDAIL